ncbi:MAG: hypothetical protein R2747_00325 [Pyrinomonadaceae bacterium]
MVEKKLIIIILNCIIIFLAGSFCAFGQENELDLKGKRITIKVIKQPLSVVFKYLIENYDVPIGFEKSTLDRQHNDYVFETNLLYEVDQRSISKDSPISSQNEPALGGNRHWFTVNVENGKLEDVLNIIVRQLENYKWEINDNVVNIFPVQGRDQRYEKLLELNINKFTLENPLFIFSIRDEIIVLPEVIKFLDENELHFTIFRSRGINNRHRQLDIGLNFSNLSFRELLNKITKVKRGGWILQENHRYGSKGNEYIEIDI